MAESTVKPITLYLVQALHRFHPHSLGKAA